MSGFVGRCRQSSVGVGGNQRVLAGGGRCHCQVFFFSMKNLESNNNPGMHCALCLRYCTFADCFRPMFKDKYIVVFFQ